MEPDKFVAEGKMEIGPKGQFFPLLDGEYLGKLLVKHFKLPEELGYTEIGRVRVTVVHLEPPKA
jgi:hypothetical protein